MKLKRLMIFLVCFVTMPPALTCQTIPFGTTPDWQSSPQGQIATGLGLADIDGDGYKDIVVANGNDINRQRVAVYYNEGDGNFPLLPSWRSDDLDYNGHLAVGDIDQDGDIDVAVSIYLGPNGFSSPGGVKVYYNQGNELESLPSFVSVPFYTFSCALGDADGDGDLDLAAAPGEQYTGVTDYGKVFINNNGQFSTSPGWETSNLLGSADVEFGDLDRNGFLDIIFTSFTFDNYVYLSDNEGIISNSPSWSSSETDNFINSVDVGYRQGVNGSIAVMTDNDQLGGSGRIRQYEFTGNLPLSSQASWYSNPVDYGSGIILADVSGDNLLDLVYGGWWNHIWIALGDGSTFELSPSYVSSTTSVVEAIQMADLGKESISSETHTISGDTIPPGSNTIILPCQLIENINEIKINDTVQVSGQYAFVPNKPWVSLAKGIEAGDILEIKYDFSPHPDMVVTNWDSNIGNYVFYNTNSPTGIGDGASNDLVSIVPNPSRGIIKITFPQEIAGETMVQITDPSGREVWAGNAIPDAAASLRIDASSLPSGLYFINFPALSLRHHTKIIIL